VRGAARPPRYLGAGALLAALGLGGCAAMTCQPVTLLVAQKQERTRIDQSVRGLETTGAGKLEEARRFAVVPDYWVRAEDGSWHHVSAEEFRAAVVGEPLKVCR
jgi:hypothetical protein